MRARIQACRAGQAGHAQGCLASIQQRRCLPCTQAARALRCGNTPAVKTVAAPPRGRPPALLPRVQVLQFLDRVAAPCCSLEAGHAGLVTGRRCAPACIYTQVLDPAAPAYVPGDRPRAAQTNQNALPARGATWERCPVPALGSPPRALRHAKGQTAGPSQKAHRSRMMASRPQPSIAKCPAAPL